MSLFTLRTLAALALMLLGLLANAAHAQAWPSRPIRLLVGFAPGGSTDLVARLVGQKLSEKLGQPVIVEVNTSGGGTGANDSVAKAPPDGYRMVLLTGGVPAQAAIRKSLPYDPLKSFGMVGMVASYPMVIAVTPDSPIRTLADLFARARAEPGRITYTIQSVGSLHHLLGEWMNIEADTTMLPVSYKGGAPALMDLLGHRVDVMIETGPFAIGQIRGGKLRPLALSSPARFALMPEVPTIAETIKGVEAVSWLGMAVAPGTPRPIIDRLNAEIHSILQLADVRARLAEIGSVPHPSSPEEMHEQIAREITRWTRVVDIKKIERQ